LQPRYERLPSRLVQVVRHRGAVLGDHPADGVVPVDDRTPPRRGRECEPEEVAFLYGN
jgi:hypothetical protein